MEDIKYGNLDLEPVRTKVLLGTIGAILGGLIGALIWVLLYYAGYITAIGGAAIVLLAFKGFEILGKKINLAAVIISIIVSVLIMALALYVGSTLDIIEAFELDIKTDFWVAFKNTASFLREYLPQDSEFKSAFIKDVLMSYLFLVVGSFYEVKEYAKAAVADRKSTEI